MCGSEPAVADDDDAAAAAAAAVDDCKMVDERDDCNDDISLNEACVRYDV